MFRVRPPTGPILSQLRPFDTRIFYKPVWYYCQIYIQLDYTKSRPASPNFKSSRGTKCVAVLPQCKIKDSSKTNNHTHSAIGQKLHFLLPSVHKLHSKASSHSVWEDEKNNSSYIFILHQWSQYWRTASAIRMSFYCCQTTQETAVCSFSLPSCCFGCFRSVVLDIFVYIRLDFRKGNEFDYAYNANNFLQVGCTDSKLCVEARENCILSMWQLICSIWA